MRLLPQIPTIGKIPSFAANPRAVEWITLNAALGVLFFGLYQSWTIAGICALFISYQYFLIVKQKTIFKNKDKDKTSQMVEKFSTFQPKKINNIVLAALSIFSMAIVFILYGNSISSGPATALLCLLTGLKLLEARDIRGYAVSCMLMYFLAAVTFSYENSSTAMLILSVYCISTTACLYALFQPNNTFSTKEIIKENSKIILKALPLTLIIFFLFPRIQGDFGFLPGGDQRDTPGFGDSISAGDLSGRAFSNALAFRAEFPDGKVPSNQQLYWRSKVLSVEDNFSWKFSVSKESPIKTQERQYSINDKTTPYTIIHQASSDYHIPTLEQVVSTSVGTILNNGTVRTKRTFQGATSYKAHSQLSIYDSAISSYFLLTNQKQYLQTSFSPKAKTKALIKSWQSQAGSTEELIQIILKHFNAEDFKYNLIPPELNPNKPIEDFLFDNRSGYCEHYASVFTTLMRWLERPARVVVGFQGGEWVPEGNFLEVRYSDAHAWSEVWIEGKGWKRVDPTSAIAPERIEFGMEAMLALLEKNQLGLNLDTQKLSDILKPKGFSKATAKISSLYRSFNHKWDKWIVNFNHKRQLELLEKLNIGKDNAALKLLVAMFILCGIFAAFLLYQLLPKRAGITEIDRIYGKFKRKLKPFGIEQKTGEGALNFSRRVAKKLPKQERLIRDIANSYTLGKYSKDPINLDKLKQSVDTFKPSI